VASGKFSYVCLRDVVEREIECVREFGDVPHDVAEFAFKFFGVEWFECRVVLFEQVADFARFASESEKPIDNLVAWVGVFFLCDHCAALVFVKFHYLPLRARFSARSSWRS